MAPKRQANTDSDRRNICRRRAKTEETQGQTISWFAAQPSGKALTQGQISIITSSSYTFLDGDDRKKGKLNSKQSFQGNYPDFRNASYYWHMQWRGRKLFLQAISCKQKHTKFGPDCLKIWQRVIYSKGLPCHDGPIAYSLLFLPFLLVFLSLFTIRVVVINKIISCPMDVRFLCYLTGGMLEI